jgi:hypothetical protein
MATKLAKWIFFSVLISICPLGAAYLISQAMGLNTEPSSFISRGELQLISVVLLATGLGELIGGRETAGVVKALKIIVGGMAVGLYFISAMWFGAISIKLIEGNSSPQAGTEILPILFFLGAVLLGGACVCLSEA